MPTIIATIFSVISLLVCFLRFSSSLKSGGCDVIVTTSSIWKCDVGAFDANCHSNGSVNAAYRDDFSFNKNSMVFRLCVVASSQRPVTIKVHSNFTAGNASRNCRQHRKRSSGCQEPPILLIRQNRANFAQRHKRDLYGSDRGTRRLDEPKATMWRNRANGKPLVESKRNVADLGSKIIRKRKSGRGSYRFSRSVAPQSVWPVLFQMCGNISSPLNATREDADNIDRNSGSRFLYSLISKLIVDVRWGSPQNVSFFLVFKFETEVSLSTAPDANVDTVDHTMSPTIVSTNTKGRSTVLQWLLPLGVAFLVLITVILLKLFCGSWRNICRQSSPLHDNRQRAHEQSKTWSLLSCLCCCKPKIVGSNPAPSTIRSNYDLCCCSTKESCLLATTRHVPSSASQSHLVTSHSGMSTSQSGSRSFGVTSNHVTPGSFMGLKFNNPYQKEPPSVIDLQQPCSRAPLRGDPRVSRSPAYRDESWVKPPNKLCIQPPPNKSYFTTDSDLIAAISQYDGRVATRVQRNLGPRVEVVSNSETRSAPGSIEAASLLSPSNPSRPIDPPPEYSEPPDYYSAA